MSLKHKSRAHPPGFWDKLHEVIEEINSKTQEEQLEFTLSPNLYEEYLTAEAYKRMGDDQIHDLLRKNKRLKVAALLLTVVSAILAAFLIFDPRTEMAVEEVTAPQANGSVAEDPDPVKAEIEAETHPPRPELHAYEFYNGEVVKRPRRVETPCPLSVSVSEGQSYYVFLDYPDENKDMSFLIKPGETVEKSVPEGAAFLYYATGDKWYGAYQKFGPDTKLYKAEDIFIFKLDGEEAVGYTVELVMQQNGNLETSSVSEEEFPKVIR